MELIDVDVFRRLAPRERTAIANVEKDYVLSVALCCIAVSPLQGHIIFKGGTCLKKIYFPDFRFSSDLDFMAAGMGKSWMEGTIRQIFENKQIEGIEFKSVKKTSDDKSPSLELIISYVSQVAAESGKEHTDSISLDINFVNKTNDKALLINSLFISYLA